MHIDNTNLHTKNRNDTVELKHHQELRSIVNFWYNFKKFFYLYRDLGIFASAFVLKTS